MVVRVGGKLGEPQQVQQGLARRELVHPVHPYTAVSGLTADFQVQGLADFGSRVRWIIIIRERCLCAVLA